MPPGRRFDRGASTPRRAPCRGKPPHFLRRYRHPRRRRRRSRDPSIRAFARVRCRGLQTTRVWSHAPQERTSMQVSVSTDLARNVVAGALVVPVFADKKLDGPAKDVDSKLGGIMASALADGEHQGKPNEVA